MVKQSDIARKLGLSESSVSRILSGKLNHDDATRANVLTLASELGYRHLRPTVRKMSIKQPGMPLLEVLIEANTAVRGQHLPEVVLRLLRGISEGARMENAAFHVDYVADKETSELHLPPNQPKSFRKSNFAGTLLIGRFPVVTIREFSRQLPCVLVCSHEQELASDSVAQNDMQATGELFNHLYALGHRRIGFLSEPPVLSAIQARLGGYSMALVRRGLPYLSQDVVRLENPHQTDFVDAAYARVLAQVRDGATAWICNHDDVGYTVASYLLDHGLRVPQDVSICGFDSLPVKSKLPRLTTIEWPFEDIGMTAVRRVLRRSRELNVAPVSINFNGKLIEGTSTAKASR